METLFQFKTYTDEELSMPYRLYVPADYSPEKSYPLILFLHGAGERGDDNTAQLKHGVKHMFAKEDSPVYQCIVVAPQCPADQSWVNVPDWTRSIYSVDEIEESEALQTVRKILDEVQAQYNVDTDRIYSTGLSMGGFGTWDLLMRHSDLFAAAIPVCGGTDPTKADLLADMPIYTFHGLQDVVVPPEGTEAMVEALWNVENTKLVYIPYPEGRHSIWDDAFSTEGLYEWLLTQKRSDRVTSPAQDAAEAKKLPKWVLPVCIAGAAAAVTVGVALLIYSRKKKSLL